MADSSPDPTAAAFVAWAAAHGCALSDACALHDFSHAGMGRGLIATRAIAADELLFEVPRTLLLSLRTSRLGAWCAADDEARAAQGQTAGVKTWEGDLRPAGWAPLILSMMWEAWRVSEHGRSRWEAARASGALMAPAAAIGEANVSAAAEVSWGPYFAVMPTDFDTPMAWGAEDLAELAGTDVLPRVGRDQAEQLYATLVRPFVCARPTIFLGLPSDAAQESIHAEVNAHYSLAQFHIMGSRVLSRSFHVKDSGRSAGEHAGEEDEDEDEEEEQYEDTADISMTPMADMLNARFESDNARLFFKADVLEMRTTTKIGQGEQIFNTFGDPPNGDLLRRYGHVDEPNGADVVELEAAIIGQAVAELIIEYAGGSAAVPDVAEKLKARVDWLCGDNEDALLEDGFPLTYLPNFGPSSTAPYSTSGAGADEATLVQALTEAIEETGMVSEELLQCTRTLCVPDLDFDQNIRGKARLPSGKISAQVSRPDIQPGQQSAAPLVLGVAQVLSRACRIRAGVYPTTMADDEAALLACPPSTSAGLSQSERRRRAALVVRVGERHILDDHLRAFEAAGKTVTRAASHKQGGEARQMSKRKGSAVTGDAPASGQSDNNDSRKKSKS